MSGSRGAVAAPVWRSMTSSMTEGAGRRGAPPPRTSPVESPRQSSLAVSLQSPRKPSLIPSRPRRRRHTRAREREREREISGFLVGNVQGERDFSLGRSARGRGEPRRLCASPTLGRLSLSLFLVSLCVSFVCEFVETLGVACVGLDALLQGYSLTPVANCVALRRRSAAAVVVCA